MGDAHCRMLCGTGQLDSLVYWLMRWTWSSIRWSRRCLRSCCAGACRRRAGEPQKSWRKSWGNLKTDIGWKRSLVPCMPGDRFRPTTPGQQFEFLATNRTQSLPPDALARSLGWSSRSNCWWPTSALTDSNHFRYSDPVDGYAEDFSVRPQISCCLPIEPHRSNTTSTSTEQRSRCRAAHWRAITPQAMRAPELPVGWVV